MSCRVDVGCLRVAMVRGGVHLEAIAIPFDQPRWAEQFLQQWPVGNDAHASDWQRIQDGPAYERADAFHTSKD
jgi:aspartate-semialdehyde dehydrogenase